MIKIQAIFTGYGGRACSLFSAYDADKKILVFGVEGEYSTSRRKDCVVITNDSDIDNDSLFKPAQFKDAINAYFTLKNGIAADGISKRLAFSERAARANPDQAIEKDGVDANGTVFRISEGITNGHVAALATCYYASGANVVDKAIALASKYRFLSRGGILNI